MFMMNHKYQRVKKSAGGAIAGVGQGISSVAPLLNFIPGVGQLASPIASTVGNFLTLFDNGEFQDLEAAAGVNKMSSAPKTLAGGGEIDEGTTKDNQDAFHDMFTNVMDNVLPYTMSPEEAYKTAEAIIANADPETIKRLRNKGESLSITDIQNLYNEFSPEKPINSVGSAVSYARRILPQYKQLKKELDIDKGEILGTMKDLGVNRAYRIALQPFLENGGPIDPGDEENPVFDISKLNSDEIKTLQEGLASLGYNVTVDGKLGPQTQKAWERFTQASREAQQKRQDFAGVKDESFISKLRDLSRDQYRMLGIPTNMNIYANDVLDNQIYGGAQHPIRNRDLRESEFEALQQAVRNASSRGSNKLDYSDYEAQSLGAISGDPRYSMKTLVGQTKIHVNPATGDTVLADRYNYNYRGGNKGGVYGAARLLGSTMGSGPGEGYPVMINTSQFTPEQQYIRRLALHPQKREIKPPTKSQLGSTGRMYAQGGQLPNQNFHGGLLHFNGPSHAEGGIPFQGVEVEGGETNWKNYVFSDRLTLKDVKKKK